MAQRIELRRRGAQAPALVMQRESLGPIELVSVHETLEPLIRRWTDRGLVEWIRPAAGAPPWQRVTHATDIAFLPRLLEHLLRQYHWSGTLTESATTSSGTTEITVTGMSSAPSTSFSGSAGLAEGEAVRRIARTEPLEISSHVG